MQGLDAMHKFDFDGYNLLITSRLLFLILSSPAMYPTHWQMNASLLLIIRKVSVYIFATARCYSNYHMTIIILA